MDFFHKNNCLCEPIEINDFAELKLFVSNISRLMLELQAYRNFQINKIVDETNKAKALVDIIPDAAILADENKNLVYFNERASSLLSLDPSVPFPDCIRNKNFYDKIEKIFLLEGDSNSDELTVSCGDRCIRNYLVIIKRFDITSLKKKGFAVIVRDITKDKEFETAKEDFLHMITHDMRSPLSTIEGYCEMIHKKIKPTEEIERYFQKIFYSSKKLKGMIEDMLNYRKLKEGKAVLSTDYVSPQEILTQVADGHTPMASARNIKIFISSQIEKGKIIADRALLERAISNLVDNAIKFTPPGRSVELKFFIKDGFAVFSVKDEGPGVPEDKKNLIFEKYISYDDEKNRGFGLGLALCRLVAEIHGGKVDLMSYPGKGSEFFIYIPVKEKEIR